MTYSVIISGEIDMRDALVVANCAGPDSGAVGGFFLRQINCIRYGTSPVLARTQIALCPESTDYDVLVQNSKKVRVPAQYETRQTKGLKACQNR
jgi:hypothetical protein